jgi:hypothetical protein
MNTSTGVEEDKKTRMRERRVDDQEVKARLVRIKNAGADAGEEVARYVRKNPLVAVGIAAGAGFVGGSLFGTRLGRMLLVLGAGYAAQDLLGEALGEGGLRGLIAKELARAAEGKS